MRQRPLTRVLWKRQREQLQQCPCIAARARFARGSQWQKRNHATSPCASMQSPNTRAALAPVRAIRPSPAIWPRAFSSLGLSRRARFVPRGAGMSVASSDARDQIGPSSTCQAVQQTSSRQNHKHSSEPRRCKKVNNATNGTCGLELFSHCSCSSRIFFLLREHRG